MAHTTDARPAAPRARPASDTRSVAELVDDATTQLTRLVRDEMQLARLEMQDKTKGIAKGAGLAGAGSLLAFYGGAALTAAAVLALAIPLPDWAAALIVGVALLALGGVLALVGKKAVTEASPPVPSQAIEGVRDDVEAVKKGSRR
ncbi:phage holin family protein [Nocardia amikacinitolerans]|uniref:phage holin family protein n=1 Tax=Nocardia amikacinitolerans TaxID=756689 RepID=UPI0020A38F2C|nr:phage holin family protein [Nocardia amikacinitolerans]MCP2287536.1 putative Holin-X, holin superfamily III [Nocardia amikacinitolerans]